jgi:hypothetical protein
MVDGHGSKKSASRPVAVAISHVLPIGEDRFYQAESGCPGGVV